MNITVVGAGYVGLSNAVLLAQHNEVMILDVVQEKIDMIRNRKSPIIDMELEEFLMTKPLHLTATTDAALALKDAEYVVISTPTNYDPDKNSFDTSSVEAVIGNVLAYCPQAVMSLP